MRAQDRNGVAKTNVNGWQSPNILQNLSEFEVINSRILEMSKEIAAALYFLPGLKYQLQAWANVSPPGAYNKVHFHANCHFSGVYYISLNAPECGSIYFRDPRVASRMLTLPVSRGTAFTTEQVRLKPEEGRIYIFPGWLEHGVEVNESEQDRVSISFNVFATP
jgi:uncharacterized protein (TIGR02466 family)